MYATVLKGQITPRRELVVQIPPDIAPGAIEVILLRASLEKTTKRHARSRNAHPAFGIWARRSDIADSASFATQLRQRVENRSDGN
jgi:hypothetical protein